MSDLDAMSGIVIDGESPKKTVTVRVVGGSEGAFTEWDPELETHADLVVSLKGLGKSIHPDDDYMVRHYKNSLCGSEYCRCCQ